MPDPSALPFTPPRLDPLQAHLNNLLLTREHPWLAELWGRTIAFEPESTAVPFTAAGYIVAQCGDQLWQVEFGSMDFIYRHPSMADVPPDLPLPGPLQLAVFELAFAPLLPALQSFMGAAVTLVESSLQAAPSDPPAASISLTLRSTEPHDNAAPIPVRIHAPDRRSALFLADRLAALPTSRERSRPDDMQVAVCIDGGSMRLTVRELAELAPGDILLPPEYRAAKGMIALRPCLHNSGSGIHTKQTAGQSIICTVQDALATVMTTSTPSEEPPMTTTDATSQPVNEQGQPTEAAPSSIDVGAIEIELCFELERRLMTVKDVAALVPGYTFTLGCDPLAPVSLRVNGLTVGSGRLVDINGILGVQVNAISHPGAQDVRS